MTDTRWRFRPRLWPTLAALTMLAVLVGLGTWQMQRLAEKQALIAELAARADQAPTELPATISDPAALEFAPVLLHGQFRHDRELFVGARVYQGEAGFHVVTPFVLADRRAVLVDRGWVPGARKAPETRAAGQIAGTVTVDGILRTGGWKGNDLFRPANSPQENLWLWMDLPAMAAHAGVADTATSFYVAAGGAVNPGGLPVGGLGRPEVRNTHFGYAMTWYALALVLLVIYVVHQSQRRDGRT
ncbi:MAG TPA: SURF1 family protein [Kiloniellales bacterium]|jgi:surfeit locus 1 family protein